MNNSNLKQLNFITSIIILKISKKFLDIFIDLIKS